MNADLIFTNGNVLTMDSCCPFASAVVVHDGIIRHVGSDDKALAASGPGTQCIDLQGRALIPGFNDAHCHATHYGRSMLHVDCRPGVVTHLDELVKAVQARTEVLEPGRWIEGRGFDETRLPPRFSLTRDDIDPVTPHHPVCLTRACGHVLVANSRALELANIGATTPDPPGGQIDRDGHGEPTGVLRETALDLIYSIIPPLSPAEAESALLSAAGEYLAAGITSIQEAGATAADVGTFLRLWSRGALPLRTYLLVKPEVMDFCAQAGLLTGFGDHRLRVGALKIMLDGGIGACTAATSRPYQGQPQNRGILWIGQEELDHLVSRAHAAGFQVATHAIGDAAIRSVLAAYRSALARHPRPDHRLRIEHFSLPLDDLVAQAVHMGVVIVTQPIFVHDAGRAYVANLGGERAHQALPLRRLLDSGVPVAASSDSPVASYVPMHGVQAAVTRRTHTGDLLGEEQSLTVEQALSIYTLGGAYASFQEGVKGSISPGKLADLVVLESDPRTVEPDSLGAVAVDLTLVGGQIVYRRPSASLEF